MLSTHVIQLANLQETRALGKRLAAVLRVGDCVFLTGDLGAGKTSLARGVIEVLTGEADAPSPTYTIAQTYNTHDGDELIHADLYRIEHESEIEEIGLEEAFDFAITLIEWPDRLGAATPPDRLELDIRHEEGDDAGKRQVRITGRGKWESRVDNL